MKEDNNWLGLARSKGGIQIIVRSSKNIFDQFLESNSGTEAEFVWIMNRYYCLKILPRPTKLQVISATC